MKELVSIKNNQVVVDSRSVAKNFGKEHRHVTRDIENILGGVTKIGQTQQMFCETTYINEQNGQEYKMYLMNRDGFTLLAMGFTGKKALEWKIKYINAFNAMEKALKNPLSLPNFSNPAEAARAWADQFEKRKQAEALNEANRPKVIFAEAVSTSKDGILVGMLAKLLHQNGVKIGQNRLFQWLRDKGYLMKRGVDKNMPTQRSKELGLFDVKERVVGNPDGSIRLTRTPVVTGKGQVYFVQKFLSEGVN